MAPPPAPPPTVPKLRESCHQCAASKVRCDKEKPTCARCAKRGMPCEYFFTKRAGRKHAARSTVPQTVMSTSITTAGSSKPGSSTSETNVFDSPNLIQPSPIPSASTPSDIDAFQPSPSQLSPDYPDVLPHIQSPADPVSWWSLAGSNIDIDGFFNSPLSFPMPETFAPDILGQDSFGSECLNGSLLDFNGCPAPMPKPHNAALAIDEAISSSADQSNPSSLDSQASPRSDSNGIRGFRGLEASSLSCCCLINALGLLKERLSSANLKKPSYKSDSSHLANLHLVLDENEQTIDTISNMLQCSCSQDRYLLVVMTLITFKVLSWYSAAARERPMANGGQSLISRPPPDSSQGSITSKPDQRRQSLSQPMQVVPFLNAADSSCGIDGENQSRMAGRLILTRLHRTQQLVNQLSKRLELAEYQDIRCERETIPSPFSTAMLSLLEADLRRGLRSLSLEIVDRLRRE